MFFSGTLKQKRVAFATLFVYKKISDDYSEAADNSTEG